MQISLQFLLDAASALGVQDLESAHDDVLRISTYENKDIEKNNNSELC